MNNMMNNMEETERCPMCPNHCMKGQTKCGRGAAYFGNENSGNRGEESCRNYNYDEYSRDGRGEYDHHGEHHRGNHGEHGRGGNRQHGRGGDYAGRGENGHGHAGRSESDGWHHSNEPEDTLYGLMRQSGHYLFHRGQGNAAHGQERILTLLAENEEGVSQRMLQNRLGIQSGSMSEILNKLEDKGLVRREKDPEDQRRVRVLLTVEGRTRAESLNQTADSTEALFDALNEEEKTELKSIMTKLVRAWLAE